jgi:hypothetical protein
MMNTDLTITDALDDPMIALMLNADRISPRSFAQLLESAARVLARPETEGRHPAYNVKPYMLAVAPEASHWRDLTA